MKKSGFILFVAAVIAFAAGCETKTQTGALAGGALGAGTGAIIGGGKGALIGGAAGVIGGAVVGSILDEQDRNNMQSQNPQTLNRIDNGEQLSIHDVIQLHKGGVSDDKIIELIHKTDSRYNLNTYQINRLQQAGVSDRVINYMMST